MHPGLTLKNNEIKMMKLGPSEMEYKNHQQLGGISSQRIVNTLSVGLSSKKSSDAMSIAPSSTTASNKIACFSKVPMRPASKVESEAIVISKN